MKKTACAFICLAVAAYIFSDAVLAEEYSGRAISAFQKFRKLNEEWRAAFLSGDSAAQKEKGKLLSDHKDGEFSLILNSLAGEYCADPQPDVLREFMKTVISTSSSGDEYPTYVFAELYACTPDRVEKEILSLTSEERPVIVENLDYGMKNITYKIESLPNYTKLNEGLENLKRMVRDGAD